MLKKVRSNNSESAVNIILLQKEIVSTLYSLKHCQVASLEFESHNSVIKNKKKPLPLLITFLRHNSPHILV